MSQFMTLRVSGFQAWASFDDSDGIEPAVVPLRDLAYPNAARFERLDGFGCQYSAQGYMDQTDWCIAPSAVEAVRECANLFGGEFIKGEDTDGRNDLAWAYRYARSLDRAARASKAPKGWDAV